MALNQTGLTDDRGRRPDWIELHNPSSTALDLTGWSLSDDAGKPRQWTFRSGTVEPHGFLVVFGSGEDRQPLPAPPTRPDLIDGLRAWWRADALRPDDPTQVRSAPDGFHVRRWPDARGSGWDGLQTDLRRQPLLVSTPSPAVRFDGLDDLLTLPSPPATNDFTLFAVIRPRAAHEIDDPGPTGVAGVSGQRWLFGPAHGGDRGAGMGVSAGTNGVSVYEHGSGYLPALAVSTLTLGSRPAVVTVLYADRQPQLAVHTAEQPPGPRSVRNPVTAPTELGAGSYGAFAGDVAEVLIYARALPEADRRGIERWLVERHDAEVRSSFHTNFRLDADGERLRLVDPAGRTIDQLRFPRLPRDVAWGRTRDGGWAYFAEPTPGAANTGEPATRFLDPPRFSATAGFHPASFPLELTVDDPQASIHFTLDGSDPTPESPRYERPLLITNRTSLPNRLSVIPTSADWQPPAGSVFKGTVVRARTFQSGALPSDPVTATYFVHPRARERYAFPVVALSTDARNLFDPEIGIYVPGNAPSGNFSQSGDAWERPVHVEFFETDGSRPLAQEAGVRMHGNTSFGFRVKALRLHAENQRGTGPFRHRIFPDLPVSTFYRLLLRPSGHDHHLTLMRDGLMQGLVRDLGLDVQGYRPAVLFINGEYWGIHHLQEAFEKHYFPAHHPGTDPEAIDYLEGYPPGTYAYEGDATWFHSLFGFLETNRLDQADAWTWVGSRMDVGNYRDYKLAEIFYYRWDIGNHRLWRPRTPEGRLRWILFDCDVGFGGFWSVANPWSFDMLRAALEPTGSLHDHNNATTVFLLRRLLDHPGFRDDFIRRAADLMNGPLSTPRMLAMIDRMSAQLAPEMQEHLSRWRVPATMGDWERHVNALRTFARERPAFMRQHLVSYFRLPGVSELTLGLTPPARGTLRCNSLDLVFTNDLPWTGVYFTGQPVSIEARSAPGWRFAGWRELPGYDRSSVTLAMNTRAALTAVFEPAAVRIAGWHPISDGEIELVLESPDGVSVRLETSTDLRQWNPVAAPDPDSAGRVVWRTRATESALFVRVRPDVGPMPANHSNP